ncbi:hypothetical protein RN001_006406 [Aquatica leii]|uniref:Uncharacterized protein n=1 Tax=Aquatica leii TaxID=1421715 RepID=A0AAN7Q4A4_9COLE|nr:hypothetical protein RN001_006406 [Aquatica leii]
MDAFVDLQGFRGADKKFIPKEVAVVSSDGDYCEVLLIKPPMPYSTLPKSVKNEVYYLENYFHGLKWSTGYINFEDFEDELRKLLTPFNGIFVKGYEKQNTLNFLNKPVVNMEGLSCPTFKELKKKMQAIKCLHHHIESPSCALEHALILCEWSKKNSRDECGTNSTMFEEHPDHQECTSTCMCF